MKLNLGINKNVQGIAVTVIPGLWENKQPGWLRVYTSLGGNLTQSLNEAEDKWSNKIVLENSLIPNARLSAFSYKPSATSTDVHTIIVTQRKLDSRVSLVEISPAPAFTAKVNRNIEITGT